jgi:UDP-N-acetylmuramyl pentapeptide synthase
MSLMEVTYFPKIDMETKIASFEVPIIGVKSQLQLGAMNVMGMHNYLNAAVAALSILGLNVGVNAEGISSAIENLKAPPHRMQIGEPKWMVFSFYFELILVRFSRNSCNMICILSCH